DAAQALVQLCDTGVRRVMLGHLSQENNTEDIARDTALEALIAHGIKPFSDAYIGIARRNAPGQLAQL
ncbi:MBL fold metallo-hydrolase, partial [Eubacteriales bacterium OttesenSCG-928-M02]|nr:MBL fold metallo-hydrolase [Eubacteriales bacterium OttesenSCG-928-M02]